MKNSMVYFISMAIFLITGGFSLLETLSSQSNSSFVGVVVSIAIAYLFYFVYKRSKIRETKERKHDK